MQPVNKTRLLVQNELSECKLRWNERVCNSKQKWKHDEYWYECKILGDSDSC